MSVTDEIKARLDIVQYITQYVPLKKAGRNYKAPCPFHNESTPSFHVNPDRQTWHCFGACSEGGDIFSFAQKYHGWDFRQALEELGKQAGVEVRKRTPEDRQHDIYLDRLRGMLKAAADTYHQALTAPKTDEAAAALKYATEKRGFSMETINKFQIGFAPSGWSNMLDELTHLGYEVEDIIEAGIAIKNEKGRVYDRFRHRLMIPIRDERGRVVGFGARALNPDDNPKYLNSPQTPLFDKSKILFGLDTGKRAIRDAGLAVIVEGYMDAIQAAQAGFYNVVAQMGTAMTETQLKLIVPRYAQKIVLALDADAAGQSATRRSLEVARTALQADYAGRMAVDMRVLQIPGAKDPDDLIRENPDGWEKLVASALPLADFVINMETDGLPDDASQFEREAIARRVLPLMIASENDLYKQENIQKLALRLRINEADLLRWASAERQAASAERQAASAERQAAATEKPAPTERRPSAPASKAASPPSDAMPSGAALEDDDFYAFMDEWESMAGQPAPPPEDDLTPVQLPAPAAAPTAVHQEPENVREARCLRMLFLHPAVYYQINRRLREIADDDENLLGNHLGAFGVSDFTRYDHRALMQMFLFGLSQAESDLLEFLHDALDPFFQRELERLLRDESANVTERINGRFSADRAELWRQHERRTLPGIRPEGELILRALEMRRNRLSRLIADDRLRLMNAQKQEDHDAALHIVNQMTYARRALERLDSALQDQRRQFA